MLPAPATSDEHKSWHDGGGRAGAQAENPGSWQKAPEEVIKARKFVKARRGAPPVAPSATGTASNPFAGISLAAPGASAAAAAPAIAQVRHVTIMDRSDPRLAQTLCNRQCMCQAESKAHADALRGTVGLLCMICFTPAQVPPAAPTNGGTQPGEASQPTEQSPSAQTPASAPAAVEPAEGGPPADDTPPSAGTATAVAAKAGAAVPANASTSVTKAETAEPAAAETPSAGGDAAAATDAPAAGEPPASEAAAGMSPSAVAPATTEAKAQAPSTFTFGSGFTASNGTGFAALAGAPPNIRW